MDDQTSTAYNALKSLLLDGTKNPMQLPLSLLKVITNNFSEEREVGSGGFAVVYKGRVGDEWVAVKKLSETVDMDEKKFTKEIQCLMKLRRHTNIVRFLGYCADTQGEMIDCDGKNVLADRRNRLLCFEFVPNGTLRDYINDASSGHKWRVSYQIIKGICAGLHYLHEKNIVHSDLKPANILLDGNMLPKIADFGLSRCFDENQSKAITSKLYGTSGYLPQEFFDGDITFKLDIYSLGVIINEILTGKKSFSAEENVLESWKVRLEISERDILLQQVRVCAEIAKMCVHPNREKRPTTHHIIKMFEELGSADEFDEADARTSLAQVLHPQSMRPAREGDITKAPGTLITKQREMDEVVLTSIVLKSNVAMLDIVSTGMLGQFGFLARVFSIFEDLGISVDCVATSEGSVSVPLDPSKIWSRELIEQGLDNLVEELEKIAVVNLLQHRAIISLIGDVRRSSLILEKAFHALRKSGVDVQMISQGAPMANMSLIVHDCEAEACVQALHQAFFEDEDVLTQVEMENLLVG